MIYLIWLNGLIGKSRCSKIKLQHWQGFTSILGSKCPQMLGFQYLFGAFKF